MPSSGVHVRGLRELERDLRRGNREVLRELRREIRLVAEPVRELAEQKAASEITRIGPRWQRMKVGGVSVVYVAPLSRRRGGPPRANLADLLLDRAMVPALNELEGEIVGRVEGFLDTFGNSIGF